jgi:hypothetical protein
VPGATPALGLPYPFVNETVDPAAFKSLADAIDAALVVRQNRVAADLRRTGCYLIAGAGTSITVNVETNITWLNPATLSSSTLDSGGMWSAGTPDQATIVEDGVYLASLQLANVHPATTVTSIRASIWQNGVLKYAERHADDTATASNGSAISIRGPLVCFAGDVILGRMLYTGTGTGTIPSFEPAMRLHKIRNL